ncbi:MAG: heavy metal translocating P-type ATPase [Deltaproteobacteria bacterium]|nr:heavy metal translocating P-type ATPase [Deltaproteobacteria bacterium]
MSEGEKQEGLFEGRWYEYPPMRNALLSGLLTGVAFSLTHLQVIPYAVEISLFVVAICIGGYYWIREGIEEFIEERQVGISILMLAATIGSAALNMWDEAAFLVFLYATAEALEHYAYTKTRHSIKNLLDLAPKHARVLINGEEISVPADELKAGDIFTVKPGESIPTDGIVVQGRSSVNEGPVTGESIPVDKKESSMVFAATMNQEGSLEIRATAAFQNNTLSRMVHLVQEAQEQKGKAQVFIERFGRVYSPLVLLVSFLLILTPLILGLVFSEWATRAVVLLVAAAPCALAMSTPVAMASGIGTAGKTGVLIKGGMHLENLGKIRAVAFDKTGTLTKGSPVITDIVALDGNASDILQYSYSVERFSEHPLAKAIVRKGEEDGITCLNATDFKAIAGYGAAAKIGHETIFVGKEGLFRKSGNNDMSIPKIASLRAEGKTVLFVGTDRKIFGAIAIRDEIKPRAKEAIEDLHAMGIKVVMLTGDNELTANSIAKELEFDEVKAGLKPEDKLLAIKELEKKYGPVAMVGDGINDAPALAQATLGIAMGTAGTDSAIEAADIALMADDLTKISYALRLGSKARKISMQNIIFSISILAILIPAALAGMMSVAVTVFFHESSELLAVANGLRVAKHP